MKSIKTETRKILRNRCRCKCCGEILESTTYHEFAQCKCVNGTFTDGGLEYIRRGSINMFMIEDLTEYTKEESGEKPKNEDTEEESGEELESEDTESGEESESEDDSDLDMDEVVNNPDEKPPINIIKSTKSEGENSYNNYLREKNLIKPKEYFDEKWKGYNPYPNDAL